jgi:serine/threonine protein kinase
MNRCDRRTAELLIADSLSPEDTARFEEHLIDCNQCREYLVEVAGGSRVLDTASAMLSSSIELPMWTENEKLTSSGYSVGLHDTNLNANANAKNSVDWSILGPTDDPDSMGRIGNYEIQGMIGRGGMDSALGRNVALKVLDPSLASVAAARKRFAMEARAMAAISHEHVVPVYTVDEHRGLPYMAMEYVPGGTLESRIRKQGPLDLLSILRIARQIALALSEAHECGLVHRDIKPANILLDRGVERVRVADFGLARVNSDASHTRSGFIAGTPQYMAPEQVRGETCTAQSDLFSLGTVIYAMCTGHSPFRSESIYGSMQRIVHETPRSICEQVASIPEWLEKFALKLLSKEPADRFASAVMVASLLEKEIAHSENPSQHPRPDRLGYCIVTQRSMRTMYSARLLWQISALTAVVGIGAIAATYFLTNPMSTNYPSNSVSDRLQTPSSSAFAVRESDGGSLEQWNASLANERTARNLEEAIRSRTQRLMRSYEESEPVSEESSFDAEIRRLKMELDAFERRNQ